MIKIRYTAKFSLRTYPSLIGTRSRIIISTSRNMKH